MMFEDLKLFCISWWYHSVLIIKESQRCLWNLQIHVQFTVGKKKGRALLLYTPSIVNEAFGEKYLKIVEWWISGQKLNIVKLDNSPETKNHKYVPTLPVNSTQCSKIWFLSCIEKLRIREGRWKSWLTLGSLGETRVTLWLSQSQREHGWGAQIYILPAGENVTLSKNIQKL